MKTNQRSRLEGKKARIYLVDDHPLMRDGLAQFVNYESDLMVCGQASNGRDALAEIAVSPPDLVVVDVSLPGTSGIELIRQIRDRHPQTRVLVLSMHDETLYANRALQAGATGYIMKQEATSKVLDAIRRVLSGDIYLSQRMASRILGRFATGRPSEARSLTDLLSDRELEVFQLIGQAYGTTKIAQELHLSVKTIETHRAHIMEKLNLTSATQLVQHAVLWNQRGREAQTVSTEIPSTSRSSADRKK